MQKKLLLGLILVGLLTIVIAACGGTSDGNADTTTSEAPIVHMGTANFVQNSITMKKGETLTLVDDTSSPHVIANGSWVNNQAQPAKERGTPTVNQNFSGNDSASVGPFSTAGTFHLYCSIHPGMNLTITVQ